ncbi:DNase I-like protein [Cystobasidium minutum MCA 4210]|uniref:DNase I-like protein n=1 Tax=Cystobasidium minutum MCA 4210 TaxID=1397322 RepID=UPI0034CE5F8E|eukprot:jgi/Rhomi1/58361/CE58360_118
MYFFHPLSAILLALLVNTIASSPEDTISPRAASQKVTLKLATLNILNSGSNKQNTPPDAPWAVRKGALIASVAKANPDVIGFQEPVGNQMKQLQQGLKATHKCVYKQAGKRLENMMLCYKTGKVKLVDVDYFWLSKTPKKAGSKGWDAKLARMAQVGKFRIISTGEVFWAVNIHFDHKGKNARKESAKLVLKQLKSRIQGKQTDYKALVFVLGDLNARPDSDPYHVITGNRYLTQDKALQEIEPNTFIDLERSSGQQKNYHTQKIIDYIMVADNGATASDCWTPTNVKRVSSVFKKKSKKYRYSDHEMLVAEVSKA